MCIRDRMDSAMLRRYAERACGRAPNVDKFSESVMLMCDRVIQGGLCLSDFTRVAVREPFCGLLPAAILEDVYTLIDRAMGGSAPVPGPGVAAAPSPGFQVKQPSDKMAQSDDKAVEQARRELCRLASRGAGLRVVFDGFDVDRNGYIDGNEFIPLARKLAKKMADEPRGRLTESEARTAVYTIIKRIDVNQDGRISFREFEEFVLANQRSQAPVASTRAETLETCLLYTSPSPRDS
eukprot:TRINITY_DN39264_c0_g1_i1.p1 TRINITY_DN39264_c0_g1~~TRINITY_DN39264_c0_g1_i1.p1  ORF type:complete len:237 (-),score=65.49 TRINITY_DN39264_c0_g1_i1:89-799(-)